MNKHYQAFYYTDLDCIGSCIPLFHSFVQVEYAILFVFMILCSTLWTTDGIVLGKEEQELLSKIIQEFTSNPTHYRYDSNIHPGFEDAKLLPKFSSGVLCNTIV